jgi:hypothetical protein
MKQKAVDLLSNLPELAFLIFSIRLAVLGASIGDALALVAVVAYIGYKQHLAAKKEVYSDEIKQKLQELETSVSKLAINKAMTPQKGTDNEQKTIKRLF